MSQDEPITIIRVLTEAEATIIAQELEREGIEAKITGGITGAFRMEAPGFVNVLVHRDDAQKALDIIARIRRAAQEIDWSKVDVGEFEG